MSPQLSRATCLTTYAVRHFQRMLFFFVFLSKQSDCGELRANLFSLYVQCRLISLVKDLSFDCRNLSLLWTSQRNAMSVLCFRNLEHLVLSLVYCLTNMNYDCTTENAFVDYMVIQLIFWLCGYSMHLSVM